MGNCEIARLRGGEFLDKVDVDGNARADLEQAVAGFESGFFGRRAFDDVVDDHAPQLGLIFEERLHQEAHEGPLHLPVGDQFRGHLARQVGRDRPGQPDADLVDADDLAVEVHQRTAGVAGKDRGVVGQPAHDRADVLAVQHEAAVPARQGEGGVADDPLGDALRQGQRAAHRQDGIADLQGVRIAPGDEGELARFLRLQLQDGHVAHGVGADQARGDLLAVAHGADQAHGVAGDVMVGDDVAVGADDEAAAAGLAFALAAVAVVGIDDVDADQRREDRLGGGLDAGVAERFRGGLRGGHLAPAGREQSREHGEDENRRQCRGAARTDARLIA
jgi:hypothetical protein